MTSLLQDWLIDSNAYLSIIDKYKNIGFTNWLTPHNFNFSDTTVRYGRKHILIRDFLPSFIYTALIWNKTELGFLLQFLHTRNFHGI
jgi:hypothetical protein